MKTAPQFLIAIFSLLNLNSFSQEIPTFTSEEQKKVWIQENQEVYNQNLNKNNSAQVNSGQSYQVFDSVGRTNVAIQGFPVYVNTGDPAKDEMRYQDLKRKWVDENSQNKEIVEKERIRREASLENNVQIVFDEKSEETQQVTKVFTKEEFSLLPDYKKQHILANPQLYTVEK